MIRNAVDLLHSQPFRYIIAGGLTTGVNFIVFTLLNYISIDYRISNTLAFILATVFAYFINEGFVFKVKQTTSGVRLKRGVHFILLRTSSYAADMGLMILLVSVLSYHVLLSKVAVNIFVIILNYAISKFHIFKEIKP